MKVCSEHSGYIEAVICLAETFSISVIVEVSVMPSGVDTHSIGNDLTTTNMSFI